jgi:hypothetical protein
MPNTNAAECESFCKQLTLEISKQMEESSLPLSTNIGYATFEMPPISISEVFDKAENAMHRAETSRKSFAISA